MNPKMRREIISTLRSQGRKDLAKLMAPPARKRRLTANQKKIVAKIATIRKSAATNKLYSHTKASAIMAVFAQLSNKNKRKFASMPLKAMAEVSERMLRDRKNASHKRVVAKLAKGGKRKATAASGWEETAMAELAAEFDMDLDMMRSKSRRDYLEVSGDGREEWRVFEDYDDAESYATKYVVEMIDDDPSMFNQSFLRNHITVGAGDIRMIASEEADNYLENLNYDIEREDYDRVMSESGMGRQWDQLIEKSDDLEEALEDTEDPRAEKKIQSQLKKLTSAKEKMLDKAKDKVRDEHEKDITQRLKNDPVEWAEELGFDMSKNRPTWLQIDSESAAKDAIVSDGVAHFLAGYDGNETELNSDAYAYRTN